MIIDQFSPQIQNFLKEIQGLGFSLCLVGGITRDYFFDNSLKELGDDLDFEIRPTQVLENPIETWPLYYKKLHQYFADLKLSYNELPYLITQIKFADKNFEFSSPRLEIDLPGNFSHHHFKAILDPCLSYDLSFKRRDFTINAIGIELNLKSIEREKIIDPYKGLEDLKKGILKNITEDFFLDSVRFLRLIRFKLKFESFVIEEGLFLKLNRFNLSALSIHHFKEELFKSSPGKFLNLFSHLITFKKISIPNNFKVWTKYTFPNLFTKEELLAYVFLQDESDAYDVLSFFSMAEKKLRDLKSFVRSYKILEQMTERDFLIVLSFPVEKALRNELFKELKNLEEKKEWRFILNLGLERKKIRIDWDDWGNVSISLSEMNLLEPPLRSYYKYYKALKKILDD